MSVSRQRRWQIKKEQDGLCPSCALPKLFKADRCFRHYVLRQLRNCGILFTPKTRKSYVVRRDKMIAEMRGRYVAVALGGEPPDIREHYTPYKFTRMLNAADKIALLQERLDKRARRQYAAAEAK